MTKPDPPSPDQMLLAFAAQTLALDATVVALAQAEQGVVARAQGVVELNGQATDVTGLMLDLAVPRVERLTGMHERLGLALRRTLALRARLAAGWPRRGEPDARRVMVRRQAEREAACTASADDAFDPDERFRMPDEQLWDPGLRAMVESQPAGEVMACVARDIGAVQAKMAAWRAPDGSPVALCDGVRSSTEDGFGAPSGGFADTTLAAIPPADAGGTLGCSPSVMTGEGRDVALPGGDAIDRDEERMAEELLRLYPWEELLPMLEAERARRDAGGRRPDD